MRVSIRRNLSRNKMKSYGTKAKKGNKREQNEAKENRGENQERQEGKTILDYAKQLKEQLEWLDKMIEETERVSGKVRISDDRPVRISKRKNGYQYYLENPDGKLEYIRVKDIEKVKKLVQKDYYQSLLEKMLTMRSGITRFLKSYDADAITAVYDNLSDARKALVVPVVISDQEYIRDWKNKNREDAIRFRKKDNIRQSGESRFVPNQKRY